MQKGGSIHKHDILNKIISIGYELESGEVSPLKYVQKKSSLNFQFDSKDNLLAPHFVQSTDTLDVRKHTSLSKFMDHSNTHFGENYILGWDDGKRAVLINPYIERSEYQKILHTEFIKTYYKPTCDPNNILLSCFSDMLDEVITHFDMRDVTNKFAIENEKDTVRILKYGTNNKGYALFRNKDDPMNTTWVPQCTICIDIRDVPRIIEYISLSNTYKDRLTERLFDDPLLDFIGTDSTLEEGLAYLYAIFLSPKGKYSDFTIRHSWSKIIDDIPHSELSEDHVMRSFSDIVFENVKQYDKPGPMQVLIELRTFSVQMNILIKKMLGLPKESKSVNTLNNMNTAVKTYLSNPDAYKELLDDPVPTIDIDIEIKRLLEEE